MCYARRRVYSQWGLIPRSLQRGFFIDCPGDFESLVTNAFSQGLSAEGFPVAKNRNGADVVYTEAITEGRQERELGIFYNSSLQAVFSDASGALFAFTIATDRTSAVAPDTETILSGTKPSSPISLTLEILRFPDLIQWPGRLFQGTCPA
jgi:hypothetical protein